MAAAVDAGIAGGFESAALIAGAVAGDPPIPDPRFQLPVTPTPITLSPEAAKCDLAPFMNAMFNVLAHVEAMDETNSRIAGARAAHDRRWEKKRKLIIFLSCGETRQDFRARSPRRCPRPPSSSRSARRNSRWTHGIVSSTAFNTTSLSVRRR